MGPLRVHPVFRVSIALLSLFWLTGCPDPPKPLNAPASCLEESRVSPLYSSVQELAYCTTPISYGSSHTITGTAVYESRSTASLGTLGDVLTPKPIRQAEIRVLDSAGAVVQCGSTDDSGNFSLALPQTSASYNIQINSRNNNSEVHASVLNCPEEQAFYSLNRSVVADSSKSVGTITAAVGDLSAAPFSIFDQIVESNKFLRTQVGSCPFTGCADFTVAPKVNAYWSRGYNPNEYFGNSTDGLSFYLPGHSRLFILGGKNGDIASSDTDHWDNSVVIHEYGHFLEDIYTQTDSPGGSHSGNRQIDPRLAWGEGWGNFIQAAVLGDSRYVDTFAIDNPSKPSRSFIFNIPLEEPSGLCGANPQIPGCDEPSVNYEAQFREFAITRFLWDVFDDAAETNDDVDDKFAEIWALMVSTTGFLSSSVAFRDIGYLHDVQITDPNTEFSSWATLRTNQLHGDDRQEYARYAVPNSTSCPTANNFTLNPVNDPQDTGTFSTSNLTRNNDFYHYKHSGGAFVATLNYANQSTLDDEPDLDLFIYNESARLGNSNDMVGISDNFFDNDATTAETETVNLSNLPAGEYLINVKMFTGQISLSVAGTLGISCPSPPAVCRVPAGDIVDYEIIINGARLCPATLP